jgi:hypothetical protein
MSTKRSFGAIRKLPSGRYQAHYTAPNGAITRAPATFAAKLHAEAWIVDRRREIDANRWDPGAAERLRERVTFDTYATAWLAARQVAGRPIKARTRAHYAGILKRELLPAFGPRLLTAIMPADVRAWYARVLVDKPTMRAHTYDLLKTIMAGAIADELIDNNPCRIRGAGATKRLHKVTPASVTEIAVITASYAAATSTSTPVWCTSAVAWCGSAAGSRSTPPSPRPAYAMLRFHHICWNSSATIWPSTPAPTPTGYCSRPRPTRRLGCNPRCCTRTSTSRAPRRAGPICGGTIYAIRAPSWPRPPAPPSPS